MRTGNYSRPLSALGLSAAILMSLPNAASACGGFFCNRQQVDQSGEQIVFSYEEDGSITTVVQIQYTGPSETFAWILPIPAEPQVSVGTDALFRQLANSTTPSYQLTDRVEGSCRENPYCPRDDRFDLDAGASATFDAAVAPPSVDVSFRGNVGPYDVAVISSTDTDALRTWLTDNGYDIPEGASAQMNYYVELGNYFVALRLQKDRSTGDIQPIVLRSSNDEPCIPVRLTQIATVPDMPVTAYFLAPRRARPLNYMLLGAELEDPALFQGSRSYASAVTEAVDDLGGHAFITDYAGDVPRIFLTLPDIERLRTADPESFIQGLRNAGFTGDSQLLGLLQRFIPAPTEDDATSFYNCLTGGGGGCGYPGYLESIAFQPSELVDAIEEVILEPRRVAQGMLDNHSHLTRLYTTLSADEMNVDPTFTLSEELPREQSNIHQAEQVTECGDDYFFWTAPQRIDFASGNSTSTREGIRYRGTDADYCSDRSTGFYPGTPREQLVAIASDRETRVGEGSEGSVGGSGLCSLSPGLEGRSTMPGLLLSTGLLGLLWRRRN